jgi:hypothetical protein
MVRRSVICLFLGLLLLPASSGAGARASLSCGFDRIGAVEVSKAAGLGQIEIHGKIGAVVQRDEGLVALLDMRSKVPKVLGRYDGKAAAGPTDPYDGDVAFSDDGDWLFYARQTHQFSQDGLHIVNVSDPKAPSLAFYQPQGGALRVAYYNSGDAEYVITLDAIAGLTINRFDPSGAAGIVAPVYADPLPPLAKVGGPASAGLYVDPKDPKLGVPLLYVGSGTGLDIYDLSSPESPTKLGSWADHGLADIEVVATKSRRTVYAATEYWFDKQLEPAVIRLDATKPDAIAELSRRSFGHPVDDGWRVQGMSYSDSHLYVAHSQAGVLALTPKLRLVDSSAQLGSPNETHEAPGSPYAMDVEGPAGYGQIYATDASTGTLTVFSQCFYDEMPGIAYPDARR